MNADARLSLAVLGAGYWGRNLVRAFASMPRVDLRRVADPSPEACARARNIAPQAIVTENHDIVFSDPSIDAVAIAAPASMHAALTIAALAAGKHVFVEKPLCLSLNECIAIRNAASTAGRVVMVGHLLRYHSAVEKLQALVDAGELGTLRYMYSTRVNLGIVRKAESAWWSLAPHDISILLALVGCEPIRVTAHGARYLSADVEDVVFAQLDFPGGVMAAIHVSWLDPHKRRELTVVGDRKMATFDDVEPSEKIRIYDKGAEYRAEYRSFAEMVALRQGDVVIPQLDATEPLYAELSHFVECILQGKTPRTGIEEGIRVVRVLDAGQRSLAAAGASTLLEKDDGTNGA